MSKFLDQLPDAIRAAERALTALHRDLGDLHRANEGHQCDCEYCDIPEPIPRDDYDEEVERIEREIVDQKECIRRMRQYASDKGLVIA